MDVVVFGLSALFYPVVSGPLAAFLFVQVLKRGDRRLMSIFWPALVVVHILGFLFLMTTKGEFLPGAGFFSCLITPIVAVATVLALRIFLRRKGDVVADDPWRKGWMTAGTVVIPLLQLATIFVFVLLAPSLD